MTQAESSGLREVEDRLLRIETRLEYVATKSDLPDFDRFATKADLEAAIHALTWRLLGIVGVAIVVVGLIDKFVRP